MKKLLIALLLYFNVFSLSTIDLDIWHYEGESLMLASTFVLTHIRGDYAIFESSRMNYLIALDMPGQTAVPWAQGVSLKSYAHKIDEICEPKQMTDTDGFPVEVRFFKILQRRYR